MAVIEICFAFSRPALVGHPYQDVSVVLEGLDFDNDGIISSGEMYQYYKSLDINSTYTVEDATFSRILTDIVLCTRTGAHVRADTTLS